MIFFVLNRDFSNLPRKYKISISANRYNNAHAEIQDLAFTPATKVMDGETVIGFHVQVGGVLSAKPFLAKPLNIFVRPEEVLKVSIAVTTIFSDYGFREKRHHARMKLLVADWGPEKFQAKLEELVGRCPSVEKTRLSDGTQLIFTVCIRIVRVRKLFINFSSVWAFNNFNNDSMRQ